MVQTNLIGRECTVIVMSDDEYADLVKHAPELRRTKETRAREKSIGARRWRIVALTHSHAAGWITLIQCKQSGEIVEQPIKLLKVANVNS